MAVIDMRAMRYLNLLDKVSRVKTSKCFSYNNYVFFAVRRDLVSKAIGPAASNIKQIQESIGSKVKIIPDAESISDLKMFVENIVLPIKPREIELKDDCIVVTAGSTQNKASLIGRDKRRFDELKKIVNNFFGKDLKIL